MDLFDDWSTLQEHSEVDANCELSDYLTVDNEILTSGTLSLEEIAQVVSSSNAEEADSEDGEVSEIEERPPISGPAARQAYLQLRQYFEENALDEKLYPTFDHIEDLLSKDRTSKLKQPKISTFFVPQ